GVEQDLGGEFHCAPPKSEDNDGASERSSAWLERVVWVHEVAGSNPVAPTILFLRPVVQIYSPGCSPFSFAPNAGEIFVPWAKENRNCGPAQSRLILNFPGNPL